jgi:hypothetical protein
VRELRSGIIALVRHETSCGHHRFAIGSLARTRRRLAVHTSSSRRDDCSVQTSVHSPSGSQSCSLATSSVAECSSIVDSALAYARAEAQPLHLSGTAWNTPGEHAGDDPPGEASYVAEYSGILTATGGSGTAQMTWTGTVPGKGSRWTFILGEQTWTDYVPLEGLVGFTTNTNISFGEPTHFVARLEGSSQLDNVREGDFQLTSPGFFYPGGEPVWTASSEIADSPIPEPGTASLIAGALIIAAIRDIFPGSLAVPDDFSTRDSTSCLVAVRTWCVDQQAPACISSTAARDPERFCSVENQKRIEEMTRTEHADHA